MPSLGQVIGGYCLLFLSCTVASAGGIGGGGLNVPILLVVCGFEYKTAVVLSLATVLGNYISQAYLNWNKRHPFDKTRPLIYWNAILCLMPAQLGGSNIGVVLSKVMPETILLFIAILVLIYAAGKTFHKGIKLYHQETIELLVVKRSFDYQSIPITVEDGNNSITCYKKGHSGQSLPDDDQLNRPIVDGLPVSMSISVSQSSTNSSISQRDNSINNNNNNNKTSFSDSNVSVTSISSKWPSLQLQSQQESNNSSKIQNASMLDPISSSFQYYSTIDNARSPLIDQNLDVSGRDMSSPLTAQPYNSIVNTYHTITTPNTAQDAMNSKLPLKYPFTVLKVLAVVWSIYVVVYVCLTTAASSCSPAYFVLLGVTYPPLLVYTWWAVKYAIKDQKDTPNIMCPGDINFQAMSYLPVGASFVIGILCSLLGIGGGELTGPLLLTLKVLPQVSSATTSMMSLFNTSSNIVHYGVLGELLFPWSLMVFGIGLCGGYTGRGIALYITHTYGRASVTIFMLGAVLATSIVLLVYHIAADDRDYNLHIFC